MGHILDFLFEKDVKKPSVTSEHQLDTLREEERDDVEYDVNDEKKRIFDEINHSHDHYLIIGKAGTGKTTLLKYIRQKTKKQTVVVTPTGISALLAEGSTIHSLFVLPPQLFVKSHELTPIYQKQKRVLKNIEMLIIDEISMVRADLLDAIDLRLKQIRKNNRPFGGVQVVMFGDLFQLPPVVSDKGEERYLDDTYGSRFFFSSDVWKQITVKTVELQDVFRQKDPGFIKILDEIRHGQISAESLDKINTRFIKNLPNDENILVVTTVNHIVTRVNNKALVELPGDEMTFKAHIEGDLQESSFPTEDVLRLKVGAQIMMLKNDERKKYVNGSVGKIAGFGTDEKGADIIFVEIDGVTHAVSRETWEKVKYVYDEVKKEIHQEVVSSFTQFPLRLAWAITIHKSQGQTIRSSVFVDLNTGTFEGGQAYTALSRVSDLHKLYLRRPLSKTDFTVNPEMEIFLSQQDIMSFSSSRTSSNIYDQKDAQKCSQKIIKYEKVVSEGDNEDFSPIKK